MPLISFAVGVFWAWFASDSLALTRLYALIFGLLAFLVVCLLAGQAPWSLPWRRK